MLRELRDLLAVVPEGASKDDYRSAVVDDNVLMKPSAGTRSKTYAFVRDRFSLDPSVPVFRLLRLLWEKDHVGQPLMALFVGALRDPVIRATVPVILDLQPDQAVTSADFAKAVEAAMPERFSEKSLKAVGERANSSYKQSGHLSKRNPSTRQLVSATPGSATMALLFASLEGAGGQALLQSDWVRLLDSPPEMVLSEARIAASRGWLELRQAGDVLDISFHKLMSAIGRPS
jgi:hypothetical protein